uniref:MAGE domain-containing protein n=1 Tax=Phocoena sinus TaxID=42100 RepID=A0A8C9CWH5_PHOSS
MPRGQKSKLRAREKRRQARRETQNLGGAQATAAQREESPSSPSSLSRGTPPSSPAAGTRQEPQGAPATSSCDAGVSGPGSDVRAKGRVKARENSSQASASGEIGPPLVYINTTSSPASVSQGTPQSSAAAGTRQEPQGAPATSSRAAGVSCPGYDVRAKGQVEESKNSSQASTSSDPGKDLVTRKAGMLVQFMLYKYKIKKAHMLKLIDKKYQNRFPEILRRASFSMEMLFGVDLKEVDRTKHTYTFVSKMALPNDGTMSRGRGLPKTGILMYILGVILMKGNCATEENIWEFLNKMRVYAGKRHFIFGEPKKLITQDLVKLKYLEYRQVANSDPARYEFLWGPRAHAETSKMKVLEFLAKVNHTVPSAFQSLYEEALKDEEERAQASLRIRVLLFCKTYWENFHLI